MREPRTKRPGRPEGGFALVIVVFLVVMLIGLSIGLVEEGLASRSSVRHHEANLRSLAVLEAGVVRSAQEIRGAQDSGTDGIGTVKGVLAGGTYDIRATQDPVNPDRWRLSGRGRFGFSERRIHVGLRRREKRKFVEAMFSSGDLTVGGNMETDAYDASAGSYASQATNSDAFGTYAQVGGHIGGNGSIQLNGTAATVRGNAIPGPFETVGGSGTPVVTGDQLPRQYTIDLEPVPLSEFQQAMLVNDNLSIVAGPNQGVHYNAIDYDLTVTGGTTLTLQSGTYFFRNLSVTGGATLQIGGEVKIYVTGSLDATGGTLVNPGVPSDLQVYAHPYPLPATSRPTTSAIKLRGGASMSMALYAPAVDVSLGGGVDFYGSLVGRDISVGGATGDSAFHYDTSLRDIGSIGIATLEHLYWREPSPPRR